MDTIEPYFVTSMAYVQAHWPFFVIGLAIALAAVLLLRRANRTTSVKISKDVLDDGEGPAARNQALIDAPMSSAGVEEVPTADSKSVKVAATSGDDLTQIKGLGPKIATLLSEMGINTISQIASWDDAEIAKIDAKLGRFQGRIARDNWVEQAKHLSSGDAGSFADKFGRNG